MAFVEVDRWNLQQTSLLNSCASQASQRLIEQCSPVMNRLVGMVVAIMLHTVLAWALFALFSGKNLSRITEHSLSLLTIAPAGSTPTNSPAESEQSTKSALPNNSEEKYSPTPLRSLEWTRATASAPNSEQTGYKITELSNSVGSGSGSGQDGMWDPYAGAAPQRRDEPLQPLATVSHRDDSGLVPEPGSSRNDLIFIIAEFRTKFPKAHGYAYFRARISNQGRLVDLTAIDFTLDQAALAFFRRRLTGVNAKEFGLVSNGKRSFDLPKIAIP